MDCQVCKRIKSLTLARNFLRTSMYNDFHTTYQLLTNHGIQGLSKFSIFLINSCLGFVIPDFRSRSVPVLCKCILTFVCLFPKKLLTASLYLQKHQCLFICINNRNLKMYSCRNLYFSDI